MLKGEKQDMGSDIRTYIFTSTITLVSALLLSFSYSGLKAKVEMNVDFDVKRNIVKSAGYDISKMSKEQILDNYNNNITEIILDIDNNKLDNVRWSDLAIIEDKVSGLSNYIEKNNKIAFNKNSSDPSINKYLPIFYHNEKKTYIIPISGKGLWSTLFGFISISDDGDTVKGITFYKHKETPGLGGEVDKKWFQENFVNKKIFKNGKLVSVKVVKLVQEDMHEVDGITGATITSKGVSDFLMRDLLRYENFLRGLHGK